MSDIFKDMQKNRLRVYFRPALSQENCLERTEKTKSFSL